jgi:hypothetical protein
MKILKKIYSILLNTLVFLFIVFEEILWKNFAKPIFEEIKELKISIKFKSYLLSLNNKFILIIIFLIPLILMELVAFLAGLALVNGFIFLFLLLYLLKGIVMLPLLFIFETRKNTLLEFKLISYPYRWLMTLLNSNILLSVKKNIKDMKHKIKLRFDKWKDENYDSMNSSILKKIIDKVECFRTCFYKNNEL